MFKAIGTNAKNLKIIKGSEFQLKKDYINDLLKLSTFTSINDAKRAASEVVKFGDNPKLSGLIYPLMQALDEEYLKVDIQYGGIDQRKILMFARENLPKINYKPRIEIMTPMIPGLEGEKMSTSIESSKIDLLDDEKTVKEKIKRAYCKQGEIENNSVLAFLKHVIMVIKEDNKQTLTVRRDPKYGQNLAFKTYKEIEEAFINNKLHPLDLKEALAEEINKLLTIIRKNIKELQKSSDKAYPKNI